MKIKQIFLVFVSALVAASLSGGFSVQAAASDEVYEIVEEQVETYVKSIAKANSDEEMIKEMLKFSMLHGGEHYVATENNNITATIFNSNVYRKMLSEMLANAVVQMQEIGKEQLYMKAMNAWYTHNCEYVVYSYDSGDDFRRTNRIGIVAKSVYDGSFNNNDKALLLVVGGMPSDILISKVKVEDNNIIYEVNIKMYDSFDFDNEYDRDETKGYNPTIAELLTSIGGSTLNAYTWEANVSFQLTVPYTCDHMQGAYQWTLDAENHILVSACKGGFQANPATQHSYKSESGNISYYYELQEPVKLYHDQPWVIEYTGTGMESFDLSPVLDASDVYCHYVHRIPYAAFGDKDYWNLTPEEKEILDNYPFLHVGKMVTDFYGVDTTEVMRPYNTKYPITYRMENVIEDDGSNMVYLTIRYVNAKGNTITLLEREPMTSTSKKIEATSEQSEFQDGCNWISGKDFTINYIGSTSTRLNVKEFKISIWTNGETGEAFSSYEEKYIEGNCQTPNKIADVCADCHHTIVKSTSPGNHVYGSYVSNNNATCTADATKTASCKYCGHKKTVSIPGTALGHVEKKIRNCSATCTKAGYKGGKVCKRCDAVLEANTVIPAKGHTYDVWVTTKEPTCQSEGMARRDCKVCNHYEEQVLTVTDHNWSTEYIIDQAATFEEAGVQSIRCTDCQELKETVSIPKLKKASCNKTLAYTGAQSVPAITIKNVEGEKLTEGTDYTYVVRNIRNAIVREPKNIGDYVVDITYIGKYTGNTKLNYSIVPAAPEKLTLELTAHDDVKLTWTKSKLADGYLVYYKKASAKTYKLFGTTTSTTVTIKNLDDNVKYNFKVVSYGMSNGQKVESKGGRVANITTLRNLAAPKTVTLKLTGHDDIKVTWSRVPNAKGYFVYYKESAQTFYKNYKITTGTSLVLKNLQDDAEYDIKVVPYGVRGKVKVQSDKGKEKSILTLENLKAPKNLQLKATGKNSIKATWTQNPSAKGYYVYYKAVGTKNYKLCKTTTGTSISITGLKKNTKYSVKVVPYGVSGKVKVLSDNYAIKNMTTLKK